MSSTPTPPRPAPAKPHWFNPFLPTFRDDPHPMFHRLRREEPVHYCSRAGIWFLTRYDDVLFALKEGAFSADSRHWENHARYFRREASDHTSDVADVYAKWMLQMDPPDHTRLRALLVGAFTPRVVEAMRPRIRALIHRLLDAVTPTGRMDFVGDLAYPLPIIVIAELLGIPHEQHAKVREWTSAILPSVNPAIGMDASATANRAMREFGDCFRELIAQRRSEPTADLVSGLIAAQEDGQRLTDDEMVATCLLLAIAGHFTTVQLLSGMTLELIRNPQEHERLRADASLRNSCVEEALRITSPIQLIYRSTKDPVEVGGYTIPGRQMVFVSVAAANRDPARFPDPDRFDVGRKDNRHLGFGYGIHFCAGAALARVQAQELIPVLDERLKNLRLAGPPRREPSLLLRGLESMPVAFDASAASVTTPGASPEPAAAPAPPPGAGCPFHRPQA